VILIVPTIAASVWLSLLVATVVTYLVRLIRQSPYSAWENVLYTPTYLYGRIVWRVHFTNSPPAAMKQGGVLVANHRSSVDPFFVQLSAGRRVHWMVAREYCENIVFGPILRAVQAIPTNRSGTDTRATKLAIRLARQGKLVGMFPEGRLNHTRDPLVSIRPGAALVAVRAGVPIIPLYIFGSPYRREVWSPLIMSARVRITFGQPIWPESRQIKQDEAPQDESSDIESNGNQATRVDLVEAEQMMIHWGKQVVALAGRPEWPITVAGRSRLKVES
jgi:1-acyl-sn-glycerol-3-phosphate acyltransferase